jgi:eukaryotic-like serine/threonine-protein kinase
VSTASKAATSLTAPCDGLERARATRSQLATIAFLDGDLHGSEREARTAARRAESMPPARARALAALARAPLGLGRIREAADAARRALDVLEELGTIEEGESLIRLVYAETLAASGERAATAAALAAAREALLARASRVTDPAWRDLFLRKVPDNARTLAFAHEWSPEAIAG